MEFTGKPIKVKPPTLEERVSRLEKQVLDETVFYASPLTQRHRDLQMQLFKLAEYLGLYWHVENRPKVEDGWARRSKRWWQF